jgi:hypothetical protein
MDLRAISIETNPLVIQIEVDESYFDTRCILRKHGRIDKGRSIVLTRENEIFQTYI